MKYKVYVRGHGGEEKHMLPPNAHIAIDFITVGQMGCTMSGKVADEIIYDHLGFNNIKANIDSGRYIYWTHAARERYYEDGELDYTSPTISITSYDSISVNLALEGSDEIGECGVCYWDSAKGELVWLIKLKDKETILLRDILIQLTRMLKDGDSIELYWTACLSARHWHGTKKAVSINPAQ